MSEEKRQWVAIVAYMVLCDVMDGPCMYVCHYTDTSTCVDVEHVNCLVGAASQSYVCIQPTNAPCLFLQRQRQAKN